MSSKSGFSIDRLRRLTARMQARVAAGDIAGVVTLVHRRGVEAHCDVIGWQDEESRTAMRRDTIFRIASMTKPVACVAALMLLEEGVLSLNDPIERWLPELANRRVLRDPLGDLSDTAPSPGPITVEHLMTHRPGFASQFIDGGPVGREAAKLHVGNGLLLQGDSVDDWLRRLGELPLVHAPGARMNYGFTTDVLGLLVGRASGLGFERFLQTRLFDPLGMNDTGFHVPPAKRDRLAAAYVTDPATSRRVIADPVEGTRWGEPPAVPSASAGLVSTADDYMKFARLLLANGRAGGQRLLSRKTIELMTSDFLTPEQRRMPFMGTDMWTHHGFGLGVSIVERLGGRPQLGSVGTYGWGGAFGTWWANDPTEAMSVVLMVQLLVGTGVQLAPEFTNLVYQAIDD